MRRDERRAFTLVELLVVVAILAMLASVGIIQILRARITTNEQLALSSVRTVAKSCYFYFLQQQQFPAALTDLGLPVSNPPFIHDATLLAGSDNGYDFVYTLIAGPTPRFTLTASPQQPGVTGGRYYFVDETMAIHVDQNGPADTSDPVVP